MLARLSLFRPAFCPAFRARRWLSEERHVVTDLQRLQHSLDMAALEKENMRWELTVEKKNLELENRTTGWRRHWRKRPTSWPWYSWMLSTCPCALFWSAFWKSAWRSLSIATACLRGIRSYWTVREIPRSRYSHATTLQHLRARKLVRRTRRCTRVQGHPQNLFRRPWIFGLSSQRHHIWRIHDPIL